MKIHEYQAKELLRGFGIPVPDGVVADSPEAAAGAYKRLGGPLAVVKAQIHAGGRGKGGGVKLVRSADEARNAAAAMLGKPLVTHQTGPQGRIVRRVYVEAGTEIARELYLAVAIDRVSGAPVMIASAEGGTEIEELAAERPDAILREALHPLHGMLAFQQRRLALRLGFSGPVMKGAMRVMDGLARAFTALDCSLAEINPLIVTKRDAVVALDAKMDFDSNALFRHQELADLRDLNEEDPKEVEASKFDLNYIALEGNIGCMVNGAGLAMATMDVIKLEGGAPANFLDVGGGANREQVTNAFKILLSDRNVRGVLINIFGGIMKCDVIAEGVVAAAKEVGLKVPLVVRLEGTNVEQGRKILERSGLALETGRTLDEAAQKIVRLARPGANR
jgi:succinyl-CoA synthetase beta subunit